MKRGFTGLALALLAAGCATVRPVTPSEADRIRGAWEHARAEAFAPRRIKAMWKGDVSQTVGGVAHGYLLVWWDGATLVWKASAPLAGNLRSGSLSLSGDEGTSPFPGHVRPADAIGAMLGAFDLPATARTVERIGTRYRIFLDGYGRAATLDERLSVVGMELPGQTRVTFTPGQGLPRSIEAVSREGRAQLKLESLVPWPEGEAIPPG